MKRQSSGPPGPNQPVSIATTVEKGHRVRICSQTLRQVTWLRDLPRGNPFQCIGRPGLEGQLILEPPTPIDPTGLPTAFAAEFDEAPVTNLDDSPLLMDYAKVATTVWPIVLSAERKTLRRELTLPKGARALGFAPNENQNAIIFAFGRRLEIWRTELWSKRCLDFINNLAENEEQTIELLEARKELRDP